MKKKKILLTGSNGFIGQHFRQYHADRYQIRTLSINAEKPADIDLSRVDFSDIDVVVHLAGKAHQMQPIPDEIYFIVNSIYTQKLAMAAKAAQVPHFIFASTVKVYGDNNISETITLDTLCVPEDPYGESKLEAEASLEALKSNTFTISILRLPLIYGPGVKGNMQKLLGLVDQGVTLPFQGIQNSRSMLYVDNLNAFIQCLIDKKKGGVFLPADDSPLSIEQVIRLLQKAMGRPQKLFKIPKIALTLLKYIKPGIVKRLYNSLVVDHRTSYEIVGFKPPFSTEYGFQKMVDWYKSSALRKINR